MAHRAKGKNRRYGIFDFAIDIISLPVTVFVWVVEKAFDSVTNS